MDGQQPTTPNPPEPTWQFQPGETITPGQTPVADSQPAVEAPAAAPPEAGTPPLPVNQPAASIAAPSAEVEPVPATPSPSAPQASEASAVPSPELEPTPAPPPSVQPDPARSVSWTASEFIAHHKSVGWYVVLAMVALALAAVVWFLTKDKISAAVIPIGAVLLGAYASRQPRELVYTLNDQGLTIGDHHYSFRDFRSFSVVTEGAFSSIVLVPLKRFAIFTTIYYDPADEPRILEVLSSQLPHEERKDDPIELLMRRIRF